MVTLLILGGLTRHASAIKWYVTTLFTPIISWIYRLQQKGKYAI